MGKLNKNYNERALVNKAVQFLSKKCYSIDELIYDYKQYQEECEILESLIDLLEVTKDVRSFRPIAEVIINRRKAALGIGRVVLVENLQVLGDPTENSALINVLNLGLDFTSNSVVIHLAPAGFSNKKDVDSLLKAKLLSIGEEIKKLEDILGKITYIIEHIKREMVEGKTF